MARTPSAMIALNSTAPAFNLPDTVSGKNFSLTDLRGKKATVIMFICNHCPYVKHVNAQLVQMANDYAADGVRFIAISSNDAVNYPEDAPVLMAQTAMDLHYSFPYLYDETQQTAKAYSATCTPDFFIYNEELKLAYRGQLDDARPGNDIPVTGKDMRNALDCLISNQPVSGAQRPSIGCNIKWKPETN